MLHTTLHAWLQAPTPTAAHTICCPFDVELHACLMPVLQTPTPTATPAFRYCQNMCIVGALQTVPGDPQHELVVLLLCLLLCCRPQHQRQPVLITTR
jgi:hypothetical protein